MARGVLFQGAEVTDSIYFRAWCANAVHAVSGIWAYDWRGMQRKHALTVEEVRAAACQEGLLQNFDGSIQASMRASARVLANLSAQTQKLH